MGCICGWSGVNLSPDTSLQAIEQMLGGCNNPSATTLGIGRNKNGRLAIGTGIHATSYHEQDGISVALLGSPRWKNENLAALAKAKSPAVAVIQAYRDFGEGMLKQLHGPFALAVIEADMALIAIDRIGIHTLSYAYLDGGLVFATSTRGVISHPLVHPDIDPQAIFNYFYFHDIPGPGTVYRGVEKVLPAQLIRFQDGRIEKKFYWRLHYNDHQQKSFQVEKKRFDQLLRNAVESVDWDGPVSAFLSGGTDSSTVAGVLSETMPGQVNAYSIGFDAEDFNEMEYARLAAQHFGTRLHEYYLKPEDILEAIPLITQSYDEPFGNDSAVPTYYCAKMAAQEGTKVILAGDGGDEIFGGNARYAKQMVFEHYARLPVSLRKRLIEPFAFGVPGGDAILPIRKLKSYIRQAKIPLPERMESYNFIKSQPLEEIFRPEFLSSINPEMPEELLREAYFRADSTHPINRMLHLDLKFTLADNDLLKVSRMCEVAGVEVRYPLLDEALVEFSAALPPSFKIRGQKLRWFFKEALKEFLPKEILRKRKHGFGLPFGFWSLSHPELRDFVTESLARFEDRGYMNPEYVHYIRRLHAEEHPTYYGKMIWVMVMLEQWLEAN